LIACGRVAANPEAVSLLGSIPVSVFTKRLVTEAALETARSQLDGYAKELMGILSVCPSTAILPLI
jgi:hypothetical protein